MVESVRLVVLMAFCSQGDNVLDATSLVSCLDEWLKLKPQSGKVRCMLLLSLARREGLKCGEMSRIANKGLVVPLIIF